MSKIVAGVGISHVPAVGAAIDKGKQADPYWAPYFEKVNPLQAIVADLAPDVCIVIYNDHASAFSLSMIPTFAIGVAPFFPPADEGYGPREVPIAQGHPELAWHLAESLIFDEFDMTIVNDMPVDHGLTVPLSLAFGQPTVWPTRIIPICVNVIQFPPPSGNRCYQLGKAIERAVSAFDSDERVVIFGTGGMSHQLQGERAGLINVDFDLAFLDLLINDPVSQAQIPHTEYIREAGSEGIELVMWLVMRGALDEHVKEVFRAHHVPTSNTSNGAIVLENL